ncbi:acylneuraminate cytidylyltransferase family protein [Verrucomicrobia bacterium]|nr:acylneuraminate cytidylyltransferase family protein [Verrucomicrobiota bacterium]
MKEHVLAISPARGGSKGIPRKNIIDFCGKPLIAHTISQALNCELIDSYIVNSEDAEIREVASKYGANTMSRPDKYAHDQILQEVDLLLKWTVNEFERFNPEIKVTLVVLLYPTAPLRDVISITKTIDLVLNKNFDSALTVYSDDRYLWKANFDNNSILPTNYDPNKRMPRQKESWNQWAENKAVYCTRRDVLFSEGRIGKNCGYVEMEKWRSIDIDEPIDLAIGKSIYTAKHSQSCNKP